MSVQHSANGCTLISHKEYIDRIYSTLEDTSDNVRHLKKTFVLRDVVFEFNSKNQKHNDDQMKRHRKITDKKNKISISKNPELHKLVRSNHK